MSETIIDISPLISEKIAVFPGDVPYKRNMTMDFKEGHHLGLSSISGTLHLGAHTDAPNHYHKDGKGMHERDLALYYGDCQVIEVSIPRSERIKPEHLGDKEITAPRILFKTNSFPDPNTWNLDFNSLSPELIERLVSNGVKLVGIDTPSVDPATDKELSSHLTIYKHNLAILEGIVLTHVEEGHYKLIALPLPLKDADASPVRAVLVKE